MAGSFQLLSLLGTTILTQGGVGGEEVFSGPVRENVGGVFLPHCLKINSLKSGNEKVQRKHRIHHLWSVGSGKYLRHSYCLESLFNQKL
jgi:hypothetical protein